jgi:hypothetical protein
MLEDHECKIFIFVDRVEAGEGTELDPVFRQESFYVNAKKDKK